MSAVMFRGRWGTVFLSFKCFQNFSKKKKKRSASYLWKLQRKKFLKEEVDCKSANFAVLQKILKFFAQNKAAFSQGNGIWSGM